MERQRSQTTNKQLELDKVQVALADWLIEKSFAHDTRPSHKP